MTPTPRAFRWATSARAPVLRRRSPPPQRPETRSPPSSRAAAGRILPAPTRSRRVTAPTLLIVGGRDDVVIDLNRAAFARLRCEKTLTIIPGATHLFEEPGTLEQAAAAASAWFLRWLAPTAAGRLTRSYAAAGFADPAARRSAITSSSSTWRKSW